MTKLQSLLEELKRMEREAREKATWFSWDQHESAALSASPVLIEALEIAVEALTQVANKQGYCVMNESEEYIEGSAEAYFQAADIAIEALAKLNTLCGRGEKAK